MKNPTHEKLDTERETKEVPFLYYGQAWMELVELSLIDELSDNEYALIALEYEEKFREIYKDYKREA